MQSKVRVYGKAQNRTALGVMHAYMVMYPQATLEDLEKAFPAELAPDNGTKKIFVDASEKGSNGWDGYFKADDELLTTADGKKVAVNKMWTKPSLENLEKVAASLGIEMCVDKSASGNAGFTIEYINGYQPPKAKKGCLGVMLIPLAAAAGLTAYLFA